MAMLKSGPVAVLILSLLAVAAPAAGLAAPPATLDGETLVSHSQIGGTLTTSGTCDPAGTSTFTFAAEGSARAPEGGKPYEGTYTESGTFTLGPATAQPDGNIVFTPQEFTSTFTIQSGTTTITGTKSLLEDPSILAYNFGACGETLLNRPGGADPRSVALQTAFSYSAIIQTGRHTYRDFGTGVADLWSLYDAGFQLVETFDSSLPVSRPLPPPASQ
jgi:hypothetical protein